MPLLFHLHREPNSKAGVLVQILRAGGADNSGCGGGRDGGCTFLETDRIGKYKNLEDVMKLRPAMDAHLQSFNHSLMTPGLAIANPVQHIYSLHLIL
ncbi:hypothetical protein DM860_001135 [Cuscuta australis]|uniref:Uncharacterized protein n=1 Tax=Cuscuta australis TaxID=267555 RepID=A0A328DSZ7_9ASTE|nr:hypothetical protein DM860_001135 [Cuscuta australis]